MVRVIWGVAAALSLTAGAGLAGCGAEPGACRLPGGTYEIVLPPEQTGAIPAVMFLHGHGGSGAGVLRMSAMVETLTARGYAVIAPDGAPRPNGPRSWSFLPELGTRDDFTFLPQVLDDAGRRFDIDVEASVLAGFSSGAFMVNYLACREPDAFAAYLPVSGGFWRPQPATCAGPVRIYHSHGWLDRTVPLEGRVLGGVTGGRRFIQGDIWAGLQLWRETLGCDNHTPDAIWRHQEEQLLLRSWSCGSGEGSETGAGGETGEGGAESEGREEGGSGGALTFELFPGGHMVPPGWADRVLDWLEDPHRGGDAAD
ncbi:PHB depolymerase family esterase [Phaeobacter sp. B1627]|uniref:alpha/beta hydrolase family esterase n=1 Tax=Phaeobacter sp. B1627 TaxID=2583809 RepID=UPI001119D7BD|nr:PHB depolymerase family esterase [Phaeobacter sp. B1627]TNJ43941.1 polyhydroxybutyrate depolymerase [Phaeobacter sp. B1627]